VPTFSNFNDTSFVSVSVCVCVSVTFLVCKREIYTNKILYIHIVNCKD